MAQNWSVSEKEVEQDDGSTQTVNCVDVRPIFEAMEASGQMDEGAVYPCVIPWKIWWKPWATPCRISTGAAYAAASHEDAGLDLAKFRPHIFWKKDCRWQGLPQSSMAAAIFVSYLASKVGAGVGRSLRGRLYEKLCIFLMRRWGIFLLRH
ncbi:MAG: hypothetical protein ACLUD0_05360 [Eubacterium ramulus]